MVLHKVEQRIYMWRNNNIFKGKCGPTPFRFENMWLSHPTIGTSLPFWWAVEALGRWEGYRFVGKLVV